MLGYRLRAALATGILLTLAWPDTGGITPLLFIAWVPLLWAEERHARGGGRWFAFLPALLLALALWNACTTWWLYEVTGPPGTKWFSVIVPNIGNVLVMSFPWIVMLLVRKVFGGRVARWGFIALWIAFERFHMNWDLSWPWLTLGNGFAERPYWVQWYEFTGHLGGSLWVLLVNILVVHAMLRALDSVDRKAWRQDLGLIAAVLLLPLIASYVRYYSYVPRGAAIEVVVVQPNVDPYDAKYSVDAIEQLRTMLLQAEELLTDSTALVVLPETALQEAYSVRSDRGFFETQGLWENEIELSRSMRTIRAFVQGHPGVSVLTGMASGRVLEGEVRPTVTARRLGNTGKWYDAYNAALLVRPDGSFDIYHKSKLVPGVELMPFESVLGSLSDLALDLGGTTGSLGTQVERAVMRVDVPEVAAAPVICYESIYGDHVAAHVRNGATILAIMTNDAWWGTSPGYRHHSAYGRLRAVETRRDVARSANTGISCFYDQRGDIHQATDWWVPAAERRTLLANDAITVFVRWGDLIGTAARIVAWGLVLLALLQLVRGKRAKV